MVSNFGKGKGIQLKFLKLMADSTRIYRRSIRVTCALEEEVFPAKNHCSAMKIPEEEKNLGPQDRLIHVYHFTKDASQNQMQVQNFGEPFFLIIHEGETLAEVKVRIQKKLQVPDEEFSKWKFAFLSLGRPEYLQDTDIVFSRFQRRDVYGAWEQYLGLEHSDTAPKRAYTSNQNRHTFEKPVKIYN